MGTQFQSYIKERGDGDLSRMMASDVVVQLIRCFWLFDTRWMAAHQASLSFISPQVCSNTCPLSWWCHPTTSSSLAPLLLLPSIFPSIRVFTNESALHIRWPKFWSSASASVLPMSKQGGFPLGLIGLISLQSKGLSRIFSGTTIQKHQFFSTQPPSWSNSHIYTWLLEKPKLWPYRPLSAKWWPQSWWEVVTFSGRIFHLMRTPNTQNILLYCVILVIYKEKLFSVSK